MQLIDSSQTLAQILAMYVQPAGSCPLLTGWVLPAASDEASRTLCQSLEEARLARNLSQAGQIANTLCLIYFERANYFEARQSIEESITLQRELDGSVSNGDKSQLATAIGNLAVIDYLVGNASDALVQAREADELAGNDPLTLRGSLLCAVGSILSYMGKYADASHAFARSDQAFARAGDEL